MSALPYYFVGVGGIGMSALARYFKALGHPVAGYDRTSTPLTDALRAEGIDVTFDDDPAQIDARVLAQPEAARVVYTPAVPATHRGLQYLRARDFCVQKRSEVLGEITAGTFTVAVAGTHGKTTTSAMVAHLLRGAGRNVTAFLGGIARGYDTNLLLGDPAQPGHVAVVEADEFDRSFLRLRPNVSVITSAEADHLDIYGAAAALREAFADFAALTHPEGAIVPRAGLDLSWPERPARLPYAGLREAGARRIEAFRVADHRFRVDLALGETVLRDVPLRMPGLHNAENALAAATVAQFLGVGADKIVDGLASFEGVKRRFEWVHESERSVLIDDYAHHPTEIAACLRAVRALYPDRTLHAIFQPHLYTRTRDFAAGFAEALSLADVLTLLPIYPAREAPLPGVDSEMILRSVNLSDKQVRSKEQTLEWVAERRPALLVTLGAGDIDQQVPALRRIVENY